MAKKQYNDVVIVGGGMAGLTMACVLANGSPDLKITIIDRDKPSYQLTEKFDGRTTAISYASSLVLTDAGIWNEIAAQGQPITSIDVQDNHSPIILNFDAEEVGDQPFGWIFENRLIRYHLQTQVKAHKNITYLAPATVDEIEEGDECVIVTLSNGKTVQSKLLIGADGRFSAVREWADIDLVELDYKQTATVCLVTHEKPHNGLAVERFLPDGPFAVLPFTDDDKGRHRSAIVWTEHGRSKRGFATIPEEVFNLELQRRFDDRYGAVELTGKRAAYPLKLYHAAELIGSRMALIGDAAHAIHPLAGQGANLGLQDTEKLVDVIEAALDDGLHPGDRPVLRRYERARKGANLTMLHFMTGLNKLFATDSALVRELRTTGMRLFNYSGPIREHAVKVALGI